MGMTCRSYLLFNFISLNWLLETLNTLHNQPAALLMKAVFPFAISLCLMSVVLAALTLKGPETGWQHTLGVIGTIVMLLSVVACLVIGIYLLIFLIEHYAYFLHHRVYYD
jgi:hypothetical protein